MADKDDNNEYHQIHRFSTLTSMQVHRDRRLKGARDLCAKIGMDIDLVDVRLWTTEPTGDPEVSHAALLKLCEAQNAISAALEMIE